MEPVWAAIERSQSLKLEECWLITQPAHAAVSAEMAAKLDPEHFPGIDANVVRAFALHDAGWSASDARAIQASRAVGGKKAAERPRTFLEYSAAETVEIWTDSIESTAKLSPLGGALVSRHFAAIAAMSVNHPKYSGVAIKFQKREVERQNGLLKRVQASAENVQKLVEALQFCDLLSLYFCCGLSGSVDFPQQIKGQTIHLLAEGDGESCRITPNPFKNEQIFTVAAIRHPKGKRNEASSTMFFLRVF